MYICFPTSLVLKQSVLNVVVFSANLLLHLNFVALNCELQRQRVRPLWFRALHLSYLTAFWPPKLKKAKTIQWATFTSEVKC